MMPSSAKKPDDSSSSSSPSAHSTSATGATSNHRYHQLKPDSPPPTAGVASTIAAGLHKRALSASHDVPAHSPTESNASSHTPGGGLDEQRTKKQKTGKGSRGVANLTPEQLAKKRANDREAQRAIRERTKNTIEGLESRIKELTAQQPYLELQAAVRQKEAVEAERDELKSRMASILSLIQPIIGTRAGVYTAPGPTYMPVQPPGVPAQSIQPDPSPTPSASPTSADPPWPPTGMHSGGSSTHASPNSNPKKVISQQRHHSVRALDLGLPGEQLKLDFLLDGATAANRVNRMQTGVNGAQDTGSFRHLPMKHDWSISQPAELMHSQPSVPQPQHQPGLDYGPGTGPSLPVQIHTPTHQASNSPEGWSRFSTAIYNCPPTCPLDRLLLDFLHERRQRAAEGVPTQEIVGPRYPSVSSLLNPTQSTLSHPLSRVFTDILATFPGISALPERVAVLYVMFLIMRWQVAPTKENYDRLPSWVAPSRLQLNTPHPAWIDHLPFPLMRDRIIKDHAAAMSSTNNVNGIPSPAGILPFENFFIPFTTTISLNWPYEPTDTLLESPDGVELMINPVFERHMRRLENWTLGEQFLRAFPQLEGTFNLKRGGEVRSASGVDGGVPTGAA